MDVEVHMLSGAEPGPGPESTCIDLQRYRHPVWDICPAETPQENGLRGLTLFIDNLDALCAKGLTQGHKSVSEPVTLNLAHLGTVRFAVVCDPARNPAELLQIGAAEGNGDTVRIFSININAGNLIRSLELYCDLLGMKFEMEIALENREFQR